MTESIQDLDRSFHKRILTAIVCAPVIIIVFWIRGLALYVLLASIVALSQRELYLMLHERMNAFHRIVGYLAGLGILTDVFFGRSVHLAGIIIASLIAYFVYGVFFGREERLAPMANALFVTLYPALFLSFLLKIGLMNDTLFDEKIKGSIHFTPGSTYEECSNGNESSIHWDLVFVQTPEYGGGEIWFDDRLIRKDGLFVPKELQALNPENLI